MKTLYTQPPCKLGDIITLITPPNIWNYPYMQLEYVRYRYRVIAEDGELEIVDKQILPARVVYLPQYSTIGFEPVYSDNEPVRIVARTEPGQPDLQWKE
jgi:hypothetical protein